MATASRSGRSCVFPARSPALANSPHEQTPSPSHSSGGRPYRARAGVWQPGRPARRKSLISSVARSGGDSAASLGRGAQELFEVGDDTTGSGGDERVEVELGALDLRHEGCAAGATFDRVEEADGQLAVHADAAVGRPKRLIARRGVHWPSLRSCSAGSTRSSATTRSDGSGPPRNVVRGQPPML